MGNENLVCPICGEPTYLVYGKNPRKDRLCHKHGTLAYKGEIIKCEDCGTWNNAAETCPCKKPKKIVKELPKEETSELTCIICGEDSKGKPQCKNCYYETKDFMESLDKNSSTRKTRDYYYNLKERIFIIKDLEEAKRQCNKLIAIAMVADEYNDDSSLIEKVYKDVETLLKGKKTPQPNDKFEEERKENDVIKSKVNTAQDGHNVDSDMEVRIDDVLYNSYILHSYGISIPEITEKRKKCDWFIPISNGKGIYVEYWGMNTPKYKQERAEKEELYKKHNLPYIGIEADEPKQDTLTFKANLLRDLRIKAEEYYGFMPEWKK